MDGAYDTAAVKARAEAWIDAVNSSTGPSGGWRLQSVQMRTRRKYDDTGSASPGTITDANGDPVSSEGAKAPDGKCDDLPQRIRRFVPGCPWALVDRAIRYLYRIAPYTGIVYNGVRLEGKYRPTLTQWTRDAQGTSPGKDATYTLFQDLVEITDCDDSLLVTTGVSCSALEETKYFWDQDSVEELPTDCEQGVTYSIRALSRKEDGTYDYQLVKTTARTRHYGPAVIECGVLSETTEEAWESAYGEPGNFRGEGCGFTGAIPSFDCDVCGVRTQVSYKRNPDCTYDVVVRKRTAKTVEDSWTDGTACQARGRTVTRQTCEPPDPPVPEVGESVDYSRQVNEDGTYDVSVTVNRAPDPYSYSWTDGSACRPRTVTRLAAQREMPSVPEVPEGATLEASISRNNDCTWDANFSVTEPPDPFVKTWTEGSLCRPSEVRHAQGETEVPDVPSPGPGETVQYSVSRNSDCTYDSQIRVTKPQTESSASWSEGSACEKTEVTMYDSVAELPSVPEAETGQIVNASFRQNGDCTYSGQISVASSQPYELSWVDGGACESSETTFYGNQTDLSMLPGDVPPVGVVRQVSASRQRDCTYDIRVTEVDSEAREYGPYVWESTTSAPEYTYVYEHILKYYHHVKEFPKTDVLHGYQADVSISINEDCTFSGRISLTKLKKWYKSDREEGGQGQALFTRDVTAIVDGVVKERTMTYRTTIYQGSGNASASTLAQHQQIGSGPHGTTVCVDLIDPGVWMTKDGGQNQNGGGGGNAGGNGGGGNAGGDSGESGSGSGESGSGSGSGESGSGSGESGSGSGESGSGSGESGSGSGESGSGSGSGESGSGESSEGGGK